MVVHRRSAWRSRNYGALETEDGARSFEIETLRPAKEFLVARLKGVADRNAAETLRNIELYVARDRLPRDRRADEFYHRRPGRARRSSTRDGA